MGNFTPNVKRVGMNALFFICFLAGMSYMQAQGDFRLVIDEPMSISGTYNIQGGGFGSQDPCGEDQTFSAELILIEDGTGGTEACDTIVNDLAGKIALIDRGTCNFSIKCANAQDRGAIAAIVCNNAGDGLITMAPGDRADEITIPCFFMGQSDCASIKTELSESVVGMVEPFALDFEEEVVLWGDDPAEGGFAGGLNGWTPVDFTACRAAETTDFTLWQYSPTGSVQGGCGSQTIISPTVCDGAITFASDFYDNAGTGCGSAIDSICNTPQLGSIISPSIPVSDFGDVAGVTVSFYQTLRHFTSSEYYVGWSTDGGMTWDSTAINDDRERYPVNAGAPGIAPVINPDYVRVPLPAEVLEGDSLQIKFTYNGNYYYWLIDDVRIVEREANNMRVNGNFYAIPPNAITPLNQVEPIPFLADIENIGALAQPNVNLNVTITAGEDNIVYTDDLDYGTIAADSLAENVPFEQGYTPEMTGAFTGTYTVTSDSMDFDPTNNTQMFQFEISDTTFAKELGATRTLSPAATNYEENEPFSWAIGNHFHVTSGVNSDGQQQYIRSVTFGLSGSDETAGRVIILQIYEWEDMNEDGNADLDERVSLGFNFYEIQGNEPSDSLITIPFPEAGEDPVPLQDDTDYIVMWEYSTGDQIAATVAASSDFNYSASIFLSQLLGEPRYASMVAVAGDISAEPYSGNNTFGDDVVPVVRMNVGSDPTVNASELLLPENTFTLSPNPTNDVLRVAFDLEQPAQETTVRVFSIAGQLLEKRELQRLQNETLEFDVRDFATGTYFLQVETEEGRRTKKFVVAK